MKAYEAGNPAYFATPPVNLIQSYFTSLQQMTRTGPSLEERFRLHREASKRIKDAATELGLKQIALDPAFAANGMTTVSNSIYQFRNGVDLVNQLYFPDGLGASDIIPRFNQRGVVIAGGLLAEIKGERVLPLRTLEQLMTISLATFPDKYFRIGHVFFVPLLLLIDPIFTRIRHMGVSVVGAERDDVDTIIRVLQETITEARNQKA